MTEDDTVVRERIQRLHVEEPARIRLSAQVEHERRAAIFDLIEDNRFRVVGVDRGPYVVHLGLDGGVLVFDVRDSDDAPLTRFTFPVQGLRRLIKDYFTVCDSYFQSIKTASPSRIEAIDMGRRGLHNEGAEILRQRLADRVEMNLDTARRLFTLICVLQIRG
ncbi:MAG: UPF0262 family protein [Rhodospirillales bacterium]|nr:MAG: UPF0262 family protein [Rhodospirillales bacterium]